MRIKKYIPLYVLGWGLCLIATSCSKDFIERAPLSQNNAENFYKTAADMEFAVNAAYSSLRMNGQYFLSMHELAEVRSDNTEILDVQTGLNFVEIDQFTNQAVNSISNNAWNDHYTGISRCNIVLSRIGNITMEEATKNRFIGEVKFLRALMYFNLVQLFGDVPLVLQELKTPAEGYEYGREDKELVLDQIEKDLSEAAIALPYTYTGNNIGRATKGAAQSLLGKVYLTRKKWQLAANKLKEVIDETAQNRYQLLTNYADVFRVSNENHRESIFEVQFKKGGFGLGSAFNNQFAPRGSGTIISTVGAALGQNIPTADMEAAYEANDLRKSVSMGLGYTSGANFVSARHVRKYLDVPFQPNDCDNNWPVLRYADVLLMYAEALNELGYVADGPAFTFLNQIRTRAGLPAKTSNNANAALRVADQAAFRLAIEQERRVELAFENHRWFDLIRTGRAVAVMNAKGFNITEDDLVFAIPQTQIDLNPEKIKQNKGYD